MGIRFVRTKCQRPLGQQGGSSADGGSRETWIQVRFVVILTFSTALLPCWPHYSSLLPYNVLNVNYD